MDSCRLALKLHSIDKDGDKADFPTIKLRMDKIKGRPALAAEVG